LNAKHPKIRGIAVWLMGGDDTTFWDEIQAQQH
jgi:spore germination protein YaaH